MSKKKLKVSDLAKELNVKSKEIIEEIKRLTGEELKATSGLEDELVETIRDIFAKPVEEKKEPEKIEKKKEYQVFDVYHQLGLSLEELREKLKEIGYTKEVSNLDKIEEDIVNKVKSLVEEERKREEEEKRKLEEEKRRLEEEKKLEEQRKLEEQKRIEEELKKKEEEEKRKKEEEQKRLEEEKEKLEEEKRKEQEEAIVVEVVEEKREYRPRERFEKREKPERREFEKKERAEKKEFERKERFEKKPERKEFEKRERFERKERPEKKEFERKERFEKKPPKKEFEEKPERKFEKKPERKEEFTGYVQELLKEEKRVEKKETKEDRELRLAKEEREEREALRKLMETESKKKKKPKKEKKEKEEEIKEEEEIKIVSIPEIITVRELADLLNIPVNQILMDLLSRKILATVNQIIDPKIALEIAEAHGFLAEIKIEGEETEEEEKTLEIAEEEIQEEEENLVERPPIVTVMGHVDHGKTTLLDTIRKTDVASKEHGGITQHIGAYKIKLPNGKEITFLDTPGHEAFTTLRARGSKVADIAILVVAADDGVKPQTIEAINHAKNAKVPIIVAVNKIDKPGADPMRVRQQLTQYGLVPEEWGGDTIFVDISAKTGYNVETLLEMVLLVAEMLELKANPNRLAIGTVIESKLDPKRGAVATVLVQNGTLHIGDYFVAGYTWGKVKAMFNERGERVSKAPPSTPVEVLGFDEIPEAGDKFIAKETEREAKQLAEIRKQRREEELLAKKTRIHLENLSGQKEINLIIKTDVQGSAEALKKSIEDLAEKFPDITINIIHSGVGAITESDVMLAAASNAIIIGFNVRPDTGARKTAEEENVDIKIYNIIYNVIEDLEKALKGLLAPVQREVILGTAEVRQTFKVKSIGTIAGCYVTEGVIRRNALARVIRDGIVIYDGKIASLKRFKEDVKEVAKGFECGLTIENFNDIKVGDIIEAYEIVEERPQ
ncbi:hypothetical protein JCM14244_14710 [Venenivibrio stagnispumantis]|uniref:Translation initiation factor IF-2 n=1 Tax=Venenivibrio stagnispumantis TaxID=407998 RepID=A0AA46ACY8_9AQUI|nr:translation initiation factor IF-2 [Venenivibrio stagnispumantis]MCW4572549.1 translation initiation factor IF-2 [Venenivibrio stagnispumantis]SMP01569.1 translation initiation factor IF-2 [Venenivibrio stagnispumantis]